MLKIREDIDLKELEKYGFEDKKYWYISNIDKNYDDHIFRDYDITIDKKTRKIYIDVYEAYEDELGLYCFDCLYDLIKADLVVKTDGN